MEHLGQNATFYHYQQELNETVMHSSTELQLPLLQSRRGTIMPYSFTCGPHQKIKGFFPSRYTLKQTSKTKTTTTTNNKTKQPSQTHHIECLILECHLVAFREVTFLTVLNSKLSWDMGPAGTPQLREHMLCTLASVWSQAVPSAERLFRGQGHRCRAMK